MVKCVILIYLFIVMGCSGGSPAADDAAALQRKVSKFSGLTSLEKLGNYTWRLSWEAVDDDSVLYAVYKAKEGNEFDFDQPTIIQKQTNYRYEVENIFEETSTCFVVRVHKGDLDKNEVSLCTNDTAFKFEGLKEMTQQADGSYILTWPSIAFDNISYYVFESIKGADFDFESPSYVVDDTVLKTQSIPRGKSYCYIVRYYHPTLTPDENTQSTCTEVEEVLVFDGISTVEALSTTSVRINWVASQSEDTHGYWIMQGSDFNELITQAERTDSSVVIEGLVPGRQYSFGVRVVDKFNRTDNNLKIVSIVMPRE